MTVKEPTAEELKAMGYRRTSNRYRTISRIDRVDWLDILPDNIAYSHARMPGPANDYYRRVYSKDKLEVSEEVFKGIPGSGHDPVGYVPKEGDVVPEETVAILRKLDKWKKLSQGYCSSPQHRDALGEALGIIETLLSGIDPEKIV